MALGLRAGKIHEFLRCRVCRSTLVGRAGTTPLQRVNHCSWLAFATRPVATNSRDKLLPVGANHIMVCKNGSIHGILGGGVIVGTDYCGGTIVNRTHGIHENLFV